MNIFASFWTFCLLLPLCAVQAETQKPNILLIIADDLGWNDVSYHGSEIETPNIDLIAKAGVELNRFYVQPSCSPTRAALMTGKSPVTLGVPQPLNGADRQGLPLSEKLLPEYLADLGYERFMVGKWHLGMHTRAQTPMARGFEHFYGSLSGGIGYWDKVSGGHYDWQRNGDTVREEGYITHLVVDEVRTLLAQRNPSKPNFTYVAFQAPHQPNEAPRSTIAKYPSDNIHRQRHAAMVDELDGAIGRILEIYRKEQMLGDTIVFFASDNGGLIPPDEDSEKHSSLQRLGVFIGEYFDRPVRDIFPPGLEFVASMVLDAGSDNSPLQGGKGTTAEGGVRVPAAIWWPSKLENGFHEDFMSISDVLPTLMEAVGAAAHIPQDIRGKSQWNVLNGGESEIPDYLVVDYNSDFTLFRWPWKYTSGDESHLYNIKNDPLELNDQLLSNESLAEELRLAIAAWPVGQSPGRSFYNLLFKPDSFGGQEKGIPLSDLVED